jgi:hypothetical protein
LIERKTKQLLLEDTITVKDSFYGWFLVLWKSCQFLLLGLRLDIYCAMCVGVKTKLLRLCITVHNHQGRASPASFHADASGTWGQGVAVGADDFLEA